MSVAIPDTIFTIGHSTHTRERFIALLQQHGITALCDVRSKPHSAWNPQFNRRELEEALAWNGIAYRFLGKELGARSEDRACYYNGKIQYEQLAKTELFQSGLKRVLNGARQGLRIALMCAEKEPLECHRSILVARHLSLLGLTIQHIHADGRLESHAEAMDSLVARLDRMQSNLFLSREELIEDAYRSQGDRIAYKSEDEDANWRAAG